MKILLKILAAFAIIYLAITLYGAHVEYLQYANVPISDVPLKVINKGIACFITLPILAIMWLTIYKCK